MTDDELREAAALALGWCRDQDGCWHTTRSADGVMGHGDLNQLMSLDWTTAGALLEMCGTQGRASRVYIGGGFVFVKHATRDVAELSRNITARNIIEACVVALGGAQ